MRSAIKTKQERKLKKPFLYFSDEITLREVRAISDEHDMSMAQFIRQSVRRNIEKYVQATMKGD